MSAIISPSDGVARRALVHVVPLGAARDPGMVGGKAASLASMLRLGLAVPDGVVVTVDAFEHFLDRAALRARLDEQVRGIGPRDLARARAASAEVRSMIVESEVPAEILEQLEIVTAFDTPAARLAVRSSAVGEDSATDSFAGQHDSLLGVEPGAPLARALRECWASLWTERAILYRAARALPVRGMGVVVQRLVEARASGVMFSAGPGDVVLIEYCAGFGDALVAGRVEPGRIAVSRATGSVRRLALAENEEAGAPPLLDASTVGALARTALQLERSLGAPQDVEWALDRDGTPYFVQSRPITAPLEQPIEPADTVLWSNANVNENYPEPISPLLYSIASLGYAHYFRNLARAFGIPEARVRAMEPHLLGIIGVHGARMYYDLTSIHAVLRMAPAGEALAAAFNRFTGAARHAAPPADAVAFGGRGRVRTALELVTIGGRTLWQYVFLGRRVAAFERTVDDFAGRSHPDRLGQCTTPELRRLLLEFVEIRTQRWLGASLADAAAMVSYAALERVLSVASATDPAAGARHNTLLKALPDVVSAAPAVRLWELSRLVREDPALGELFAGHDADAILHRVRDDARFAAFRRALDRYLEEWGFRCSAELMLTVPSFQERPAPVIEMVRAYLGVEGDSPREAMRRQEEERLRETSRAMRELRRHRLVRWLPGVTRAHAARVTLPLTHAAIAYRERARLKQALLYSRCRRIVLALGERLVQARLLESAGDAFFLTVDELDALAAGRAMFPQHAAELVALRRRAHAQVTTVTPPDTFELPRGAYLSPGGTPRTGSADPASDEITDASQVARTSTIAPEGGDLCGTSACGGTVTARASVLRDVSEADRLAAGDVLVTRQTDPGWGPVFFLVRGLIIERGGMLSHGAILAREFGLPCVVGVRDATRRIPHGVTVTVDGDLGRVRLHD